MKQVSTQAQVQVLSRDQALRNAAWAIAKARERLAELYSWAIAGAGSENYITPLLLAREIHEALTEAIVWSTAFASVENFSESAEAFLEEARLEAARILRQREAAQPAAG
ncbi:hypothetical protein, partial [Thermus sp. FJN-A]